MTDQIIAQEIVRSVVGTLGLIAAVPVTTGLAALAARRAPVIQSPGPRSLVQFLPGCFRVRGRADHFMPASTTSRRMGRAARISWINHPSGVRKTHPTRSHLLGCLIWPGCLRASITDLRTGRRRRRRRRPAGRY